MMPMKTYYNQETGLEEQGTWNYDELAVQAFEYATSTMLKKK